MRFSIVRKRVSGRRDNGFFRVARPSSVLSDTLIAMSKMTKWQHFRCLSHMVNIDLNFYECNPRENERIISRGQLRGSEVCE
jgi:hypothetical protein